MALHDDKGLTITFDPECDIDTIYTIFRNLPTGYTVSMDGEDMTQGEGRNAIGYLGLLSEIDRLHVY